FGSTSCADASRVFSKVVLTFCNVSRSFVIKTGAPPAFMVSFCVEIIAIILVGCSIFSHLSELPILISPYLLPAEDEQHYPALGHVLKLLLFDKSPFPLEGNKLLFFRQPYPFSRVEQGRVRQSPG